MNVDAADQLADGERIKVGVIANGVSNPPDLIRPDGSHVLFDYRDFSGFGPGATTDGREAFLDAGAIASQGNQTYDLSGFVNPAHPLPRGCNIKIKGIAPGASLAVLNVAGRTGWEANNIAALSSGGITEFNPHTVDVVAPGDAGWTLCSSDITAYSGCTDPSRSRSLRTASPTG
jgi:hypothetical protein